MGTTNRVHPTQHTTTKQHTMPNGTMQYTTHHNGGQVVLDLTPTLDTTTQTNWLVRVTQHPAVPHSLNPPIANLAYVVELNYTNRTVGWSLDGGHGYVAKPYTCSQHMALQNALEDIANAHVACLTRWLQDIIQANLDDIQEQYVNNAPALGDLADVVVALTNLA